MVNNERSRPTILVVDDEAQHLQIARYLLGKSYNVLTAENGEAAIQVAKGGAVDVALVDYRMPGLSGVEVLQALKDIAPNCLRFLVTAYSDENILREAINAASVYRFVSKPVSFPALETDIQRALEHRQATDQATRSEKMAMAGALASVAVHDLRNSVQGLMLLPIWIDSGTDEDRARAKKTLAWAQATMMNCISEILTVVKGGTPKYDLQRGSIEPIIRETVEAHAALHRDVVIRASVADPLPAILRSEKHVQRMLGNLLSNAVQATPAGGSIEVKAGREGEWLSLSVTDSGAGIPKDVQRRIFEPLFSTKGHGGVGLGLRLCLSVMEAHSGSLNFASEEGRGTTFTALFPLGEAGGQSSRA